MKVKIGHVVIDFFVMSLLLTFYESHDIIK